MKTNSEAFVRAGMAAYLPGMVYMLELMQRTVDEFRELLRGSQAREAQEDAPRRRERPKKGVEKESKPLPKLPDKIGDKYTLAGAAKELGTTYAALGQYVRWYGLNRDRQLGASAPHPTRKGQAILVFSRAEVEEMRAARSKAEVPAVRVVKTHPRDPNHPDHEKWRRKMKRAQQKRIQAMSPEQYEAYREKMRAFGKRRHAA